MIKQIHFTKKLSGFMKSISLTAEKNKNLVEMSSSWNFPARASPSCEDSEPSRARALQFPSWNQADNTDNMYAKK